MDLLATYTTTTAENADYCLVGGRSVEGFEGKRDCIHTNSVKKRKSLVASPESGFAD